MENIREQGEDHEEAWQHSRTPLGSSVKIKDEAQNENIKWLD